MRHACVLCLMRSDLRGVQTRNASALMDIYSQLEDALKR